MTIASLIPNELKDLLREIEALGFSLCLVGGTPRDYFLNKTLSYDLDFEIRNLEASVLRSFFKNKKINYTELPYQITRVDFHGFDLEFSTPRIERQIVGNKTHHHFEAELSPTLSYQESFKRRDFTLNAIGVELDMKKNSEVVVDPYGGVKDLKDRVLREISDDFFLDSVRFLRLIRFSMKYDLKISDSIMSRLSEFDLSELSKHHFVAEMMKSKVPGLFINKFNEMVESLKLSIPAEFKIWNGLKFTSENKTKDDLLVSSFLQKEESAKLVSAFFLMPEKRAKDLKSFYDSFMIVKKVSKEELITLSQKSINDLTDPGLLKELKNLEEKKEWQKYFTEPLLVSWSDWESVNVDSFELESTPVKMRSYLRFHKALQKSFKA
jgi:tRNA nucleotidyltransferase (CCA-adding enzyme)